MVTGFNPTAVASDAVTGTHDLAASPVPRQSVRFHFLDGLRGVAALAVAVYHIAPFDRAAAFLPAPLPFMLDQGKLGVAVFFVLSGFVIAYSQRGIFVTGRFLGNFALSRSLRLDPPYWATIALVLVIHAAMKYLGLESLMGFPTLKNIAVQMVYLQDVLHTSALNPVFWTLCYEVQFYLVLTLLTGLAQRMPFWNRRLLGVKNGSRLLIFLPLALVSMSFLTGWLNLRRGFFIDLWYSFFFGVMVWNAIEKSVSTTWLWIFTVGVLSALLPRIHAPGIYYPILWICTMLMTGWLIYTASVLGQLERWLSGTIIQFFGRISYSLYLVHIPVCEFLNRFTDRVCHGSPMRLALWTFFTLLLCILAAYGMYRCVERPSLHLAHRLKARRRAAIS